VTCAVNNDKTRTVPTRRHYQYMIMCLEISRSNARGVSRMKRKRAFYPKQLCVEKVVKKKKRTKKTKVYSYRTPHRTQRVKRVKEEEEEEPEDFDEI